MLHILAAMLMLISCGEKGGTPVTPEVKLSASPMTLDFPAEGGEKTFTVTSASNPNLSPWEKWYTVNKGPWNEAASKADVTVTAPENKSTEALSGKISVVCGEEKIYVEISQAAGKENNNGNKAEFPVPDEGAAWTAARKFGIGWNLGNHFDAHVNEVSSETGWGNPKATQATFDKVKAAGFNTVRIPVTWMGHIGEAPDYHIEDAWLDRVAEVVGYAEKAGLNVILNMHHDGADSKYWLNIASAAASPAVHQQIMDQISAMWKQIAEKFSDKGDFLVFEAFNEIHDGKWGNGANRTDGGRQYKCLNEWNQVFVDAVRSAGGGNADRYLGIPAYCTNVDIAIETWEMPEDNTDGRLMVSVHCYDPYDYTLPATKSEWGHTAAASKKVAGDNEADLEAVFRKLYDHFMTRDIPVYLGEFGCVNRETVREQAFQQYYMKYFAKLSKLYGIPSVLWDNGAKGHGNERHAYFDHGTGEFCSPEAEAAVKALVGSYNNDLTLKQIYDSAPM